MRPIVAGLAVLRRRPLSYVLAGGVAFGVHAQTVITSDGTLPTPTTVTRAGNVYDIDGGTIRGGNQFHSFGRFGVAAGDTARFNGPADIANILSRVTGGIASDIDGTLRTTINGANLFLINPAGVIFGPNASLDVSGSFHASTADYVRLEDRARFNAVPSVDDALLSASPPTAFGFLDDLPASLSIDRSRLRVPPGKSLSLVVGDIAVSGGGLSAPGGRVNLVSVASAGEVTAASPGVIGALHVDAVDAFGSIDVSESSVLDVSSAAGAGTVFIRGGSIVLESSTIASNTLGGGDGAGTGIEITADETLRLQGSLVQAATAGFGGSGDIRVAADDVTIEATDMEAFTVGPGESGGIRINASSVEVSNFSDVEVVTFGSGNTGDIEIVTGTLDQHSGGQTKIRTAGPGSSGNLAVAADWVRLSSADNASRPAVLSSLTFPGSSGSAGDVRITAGTLEVVDGAQIDTSSSGTGSTGVLRMEADTVRVGGRNAFAAAGVFARPGSRGGSTGGVSIETDLLEVRAGGQISATSVGGGSAGDIEIFAERVLLTENDTFGVNSGLPTGLFARGGFGPGADVRIQADQVTVLDGAAISTSSRRTGTGGDIGITADRLLISGVDIFGNRAGVFSQTDGPFATGAAGHIRIAAESVEVRDGGEISIAGFGPGASGELDIEADSILLSGRRADRSARVVANTSGAADAGGIRLSTDSLQVLDGAQIEATTTGPAGGGDIRVDAQRVLVSGVHEDTARASRVVAQTILGATGDAGSIEITAANLEVTDGAEIAVNTFTSGAGGTITVNAQTVTLDGGIHPEFGVGLFSESLSSGAAGDVRIDTSTLEVTGGAQISSSVSGSGKGGVITVNAQTVALSGRTGAGVLTGLLTRTESDGEGGQVRITTDVLEVGNSAVIDSSAFAAGSAGDITLEGKTIGIRDRAIITSSTAGGGTGGDIELTADQVILSGNALIASESSGTGLAGDVRIRTSESFQSFESDVRAGAIRADGGNIIILANDLVYLVDSTIATEVKSGVGAGGNISIDPEFVVLNTSRISANAFGGPGGNIQIAAEHFIASTDSVIEASSIQSVAGTVVIESPETEVATTLMQLPQEFFDISGLLAAHCAARRGAAGSSFEVAGRGGLPVDPDGYLPSFHGVARLGVAGAPPRSHEQIAAADMHDEPSVLLAAATAFSSPGCNP